MNEPILNPTKKQLATLRGIIYGIHNKTNGKWYVGQTVNTFVMRYGEDPCQTGVFNRHLRASINKHGWNSFELTIFEHGIKDIDELNRLEHDYATKQKSYEPFGYNVKPCGNGQGTATLALRQIASINAAQKEWIFKHIESGEIFQIKNLSQFAKSRGLDNSVLNRVINQGYGVHRGYGALTASLTDNLNKRIYTLHPNMPKGPYTVWYKKEKHVFLDIKGFMKQRGLIDASAFYEFLEGKRKAYKGYTMEPKEIVWVGTRYCNIRLINSDGVVFTYDSIKDCVAKTGTKEGHIRQMIYGNRKIGNGYRLVDFQKRVVKQLELL